MSILSVQLSAFPAVLNCYVWYSVIQSSRLQHWMIMFVGPRHDQSVDQWPLTRRPATTTLGRRGQTGCQCSLDTHMQVELPGSVFRYIRQSWRLSFLSVFQASFSCVCKVFDMDFFRIKRIKHRLITKLITEFVCKLRDESN